MTFTIPNWLWVVWGVTWFFALIGFLSPFFSGRKKRPIEWVMRLENDPMERMKRGRKVVEFRLNKIKWCCIQKGHIVEFQSMDNLRFLRVEVLETFRLPDFETLLRECEDRGLLERSYNEQLARLKERYPEDERKKYPGVFGFQFRVLQ